MFRLRRRLKSRWILAAGTAFFFGLASRAYAAEPIVAASCPPLYAKVSHSAGTLAAEVHPTEPRPVDIDSVAAKLELTPIIGKDGKKYHCKVTGLSNDYNSRGFNYEVFDESGAKVGRGFRGYNPTTRSYQGGAMYLDDVKSNGLGRGLHNFFFDQATPGTKITFLSDETRTNATIDAWVEQMSGDSDYVKLAMTSSKKADQLMEAKINQKIQALVAEGKERDLPFWVGFLRSVGWRDVHINYSRDHGVSLFGTKPWP